MNTHLITLVISFFAINSLQAQQDDKERYMDLALGARDHFKVSEYDSCKIKLSEAFKIRQTSTLSTLRYAACAYSTDDEELYRTQMEKAFELNWSSVKEIFDDYEEFSYLKATGFEKLLLEKYEYALDTTSLDIDLMKEFGEIRVSDQKYRQEMRGVADAFGWDSPQMDSLWALQNPIDSANTARICEIIDERGYPGNAIVGSSYASVAFLVIQHADLETQEKYLDVITSAADEGEVRWSSVALLVDRVEMRNGNPQIYGSQVSSNKETGEYYFARINDPHNIDSIRSSVGLGPIQGYADRWNFTFDPDKHIALHDKLDAEKEAEEAAEKTKADEDKK